MSSTARATPNIALIKYWGNRNNEMRLPAADSVSMTLDHPHVEITVDHADTFSLQSFEMDGTQKLLDEKAIKRFEKHLELTKNYLSKLGAPTALPTSVKVIIRSMIPPSIGLASSAAVFACLAKAYAGLIAKEKPLTDREVSVIARFGSGSAARSIFGGYASFLAGKGEDIDAAYGEQVVAASHWTLHDIVIIPSTVEKKVGSTEGHELAWTSPDFTARLNDMKRRNEECIAAIKAKDFGKLQYVAEEDALDMHHVMETSEPSIQYLTPDTHRIILDVEDLRATQKVPVLYTMDAGPTVHLFCPDESVELIRGFAKEITGRKGWKLYEARTGEGASFL